ncbi:hypothetical protein KC331_g540 [Hortaea werneckii]|nr:hypothetical protein KC323_g8733 [Hortaea werneckii]KAI7344754.1 hypothetical protein KC320_g8669 [Hortaea werneckii]KAI7554447.1 hypothetical protein KC331_g540 [Hortaea werneckii]
MVFTSGMVPTVNGSIPTGIKAQTVAALDKITAIIEEAGTSWDNALETTVLQEARRRKQSQPWRQGHP